MINNQKIKLWNAVHDYVRSCGGDPEKYIHGNGQRMAAVSSIESIAFPNKTSVASQLFAEGYRFIWKIDEFVDHDNPELFTEDDWEHPAWMINLINPSGESIISLGEILFSRNYSKEERISFMRQQEEDLARSIIENK